MTTLPRAFRRIRLELAREPGYPEGTRQFGYVFVAPLDPDGRIDPVLWKEHRDHCRVVRIRPDDQDVGHLIQQADGEWAFHYDVAGDEPDETGYRFGDERFVTGEYVSVRENGNTHTFRVSSVEHI